MLGAAGRAGKRAQQRRRRTLRLGATVLPLANDDVVLVGRRGEFETFVNGDFQTKLLALMITIPYGSLHLHSSNPTLFLKIVDLERTPRWKRAAREKDRDGTPSGAGIVSGDPRGRKPPAQAGSSHTRTRATGRDA